MRVWRSWCVANGGWQFVFLSSSSLSAEVSLGISLILKLPQISDVWKKGSLWIESDHLSLWIWI